MKKLSKIVALLLAGALTMLLFTACGGGGGDGMATKKTEEDKVISLVKKDHSNAVVTNDEGLRAIADTENQLLYPPERLPLPAAVYGRPFPSDAYSEGTVRSFR